MDGRIAEELLGIAEEAGASLRTPRSKAALGHLELDDLSIRSTRIEHLF